MVESLRDKDMGPKERLKKLEAEFGAIFQVDERINPKSAWMHALSDLCDYFDSIVNKVIVGMEVNINEEGLLKFINRKSFGNDEYSVAHRALFRHSASLLHAYEAVYMGRGSIAKTRRFLINQKNVYFQEFKNIHGQNK